MKLSGHHKIRINTIIWSVLGVIVIAFFVRVALWEQNYYATKEGSERETPTVYETEEVDETEVTVEQRAEYTVPDSHPRYLSIEKLGITNARVISLGLKSNGEIATPTNIFDVGWYNASGLPGKGGTMVIDAHNGGPNVEGVFKHLDRLVEGDLIVIERGDGAIFHYEVVENKAVSIENGEADNYMITALSTPEPGKESITLITCIGTWSNARQTYLSRQFTRAVLVDEE